MAKSFQKEIPKARVNITLDLETGGAKKKKELPLKVLALGDFSRGKTTGPVAERERIDINKNNFDNVLKELSPELKLTVPNAIKNDGTEIKANLKFNSYKDFHPENIAEQIPELKNLLAMRNLLKDLKSNVLDNTAFRKELEKILKQEHGVQGLLQELKLIKADNAETTTE